MMNSKHVRKNPVFCSVGAVIWRTLVTHVTKQATLVLVFSKEKPKLINGLTY